MTDTLLSLRDCTEIQTAYHPDEKRLWITVRQDREWIPSTTIFVYAKNPEVEARLKLIDHIMRSDPIEIELALSLGRAVQS